MTESLSEYPADYVVPDLKGHHHLLDRFFTCLSKGSLHHAWLLSGPEGIGKFKASLHIAAWLLSLPKLSNPIYARRRGRGAGPTYETPGRLP